MLIQVPFGLVSDQVQSDAISIHDSDSDSDCDEIDTKDYLELSSVDFDSLNPDGHLTDKILNAVLKYVAKQCTMTSRKIHWSVFQCHMSIIFTVSYRFFSFMLVVLLHM